MPCWRVNDHGEWLHELFPSTPSTSVHRIDSLHWVIRLYTPNIGYHWMTRSPLLPITSTAGLTGKRSKMTVSQSLCGWILEWLRKRDYLWGSRLLLSRSRLRKTCTVTHLHIYKNTAFLWTILVKMGGLLTITKEQKPLAFFLYSSLAFPPCTCLTALS